MMSNRKPFNDRAGYIASKKNTLTGSHNVIYIAAEQGIDADRKYVTVCEGHKQMVSSTSVKNAYVDMRNSSQWCTDCQSLVATKGIIFDDSTSELVNKHDWGISTKGYAQGSYRGKMVYMHRFLWETFNGPIPKGWQIDHINGNKLDNRLENLRVVTPRRQQWNLKGHREGTFSSSYVGVSWDRKLQKWQSRITINGRNHGLGMYDSELDAHNAYMAKVAELEGSPS
jgi:HNH endonuclease